MMELRTISIYLICILLAVGCYYDVEEELYGTVECQTTNMSYANDIMPIIEKACYTCHSVTANFANVTLEGYGPITNYVDNGALLGVIRHESGFSPMPKNQAMLLQCEIEKIESWILDGALNN